MPDKSMDWNEGVLNAKRIGWQPAPGLTLQAVCRGHLKPIGRIAWSPCGRFLASPSADSTVRVWDVQDGSCIAVLNHSEPVADYTIVKDWECDVVSVAWSPDGKLLATAGLDSRVGYPGRCCVITLWAVDGWTMLKQLGSPTLESHGRRARTPAAILELTGSDRMGGRTVDQVLLDADRERQDHRERFLRHHIGRIHSLVWLEDSHTLLSASADSTVRLWDVASSNCYILYATDDGSPVFTVRSVEKSSAIAIAGFDNQIRTRRFRDAAVSLLTGHTGPVWDASVSADDKTLASASSDMTVRLWNLAEGEQTHILEFHKDAVQSVAFSPAGDLLASKSKDGSVQLLAMDTLNEVARIPESSRSMWATIAFSPTSNLLATFADSDHTLRIWQIENSSLIRNTRKRVLHASAKVVLVGESNVGKSCLAMRLAEDRYPDDHEHGTTHGMRFWPMQAEQLHPRAKAPEGQRRDVVLWDFGGQDEYHLVHQMFLHDTTVALVLIDPTRGRVALTEAREWNRRLEKHLRHKHAVKLLVGTQVDDDNKSALINRAALHSLCEECGFSGFFETSSLNGRGIDRFRDALADALDWDSFAKTSRPELFQRIRDEIELMREAGEVVVLISDLQTSIRDSRTLAEPPRNPTARRTWDFWKHKVADTRVQAAPEAIGFDDTAFGAVTEQLATQGVIVKTKLTSGDNAIVLQLPVLERYAASLIVAARDNPRGVPALEAIELGSPAIALPGMTNEQRVPRNQERIVLEAVAELMIEHGLCFRHEGLLVFPTLLQATETSRTDELPGSVSLYYDFSGAIDNVYASLISWLVIGQGFGRIRLWENRVEFEAEGHGVCGLRKVNRGGGFAHLDVYFHDATPLRTQTEFISFVHQHLRSSGIDVIEHFELICANVTCRYEFPREVVQNRMAKGETDVVCPQCEVRTKLSEGLRHERVRDEQADRRSFALMTRVRQDVPKIVANVKERAFSRADEEYGVDRPIRILHLSDLHFTSDTVPPTQLQWLHDDLRKGRWLGNGELDYVVISGDVTHRGSEQGLRRASEFVSLIIDQFGLSAERFVVVPGNHDLHDLDEAYHLRQRPSEDEKERGVQQGSIWLVPNPERYKDRLRGFSEQFYHPLLQKPYPLDPTRQGVAYTFPETRLQFLTLNSCWEIDQFHRTRASIHPDAMAGLIREADHQIQRAIGTSSIAQDDYFRVAVWHHPVADVERGIRNREFLSILKNNRVRVCLTGDVHEMRREVIDYWHERRMHVVGAGSFGAKGPELNEGSPRLYNVLEVDRQFKSIRVHTRQQPKLNGPWRGWNEWPMPDDAEGGLPYFDIPIT